jgi:hypothetical protein
LAGAFHATLIILILYYLDTRQSIEDRLPPWMIVYGIVYNKTGFLIRQHCPIYYQKDDERRQAGSYGWGAITFPICYFDNAFTNPPGPRPRALAALQRLSGHAQHILEKLQNWEGYATILSKYF